MWRPARPAAAWRQFVLIGRFPAVLMPTNGAPQGTILAWCAPCRTDEPRPVRSDLCDTRLGGSICVATLIKRTLPPLSTHHPPVTPLISPSLPTAQGLAQAEKPKPAWSGPSQPKSLHGRGDGEATSIRSSCAPARCFAAATCAPRTSGRASLMDSEDHGSSATSSRQAWPQAAAVARGARAWLREWVNMRVVASSAPVISLRVAHHHFARRAASEYSRHFSTTMRSSGS